MMYREESGKSYKRCERDASYVLARCMDGCCLNVERPKKLGMVGGDSGQMSMLRLCRDRTPAVASPSLQA